MEDGWTAVERYEGGEFAWLQALYYFDVPGKAAVDNLIGSGALPVDTRSAVDYALGHLPGALWYPAALITASPDAFLLAAGTGAVVLYGAGAPDAALRQAAAAVEGRAGRRIYLYTGGYANY